MELLSAVMALFCLVLQWQLVRMDKRLRECEHSKAAVEILADQVCELSGDFYGPVSE